MTSFATTSLVTEMLKNVYTAGTVYVKLHVGNPGEAGAGNPAAEAKRKGMSLGYIGATRHCLNAGKLEWPEVSTKETYTFFSLWTTEGGGTFLGYGEFSEPIPMEAGNTFEIESGKLLVEVP